MKIIRGEVGEAGRSVLLAAFRHVDISESELARRLRITQPGAFLRLNRKNPDGQPSSIGDAEMRETAAAMGYGVRIELVPLEPAASTTSPPTPLTQTDAAPKPKRRPKG